MLTGVAIARQFVTAATHEMEAKIESQELHGKIAAAYWRGMRVGLAAVLELDEQTPVSSYLAQAGPDDMPLTTVTVERVGELGPVYVLTGPGFAYPADRPEVMPPAWFGFVTRAELADLRAAIDAVLAQESQECGQERDEAIATGNSQASRHLVKQPAGGYDA